LQSLIDAIAKSQFEDLQRRVESRPDRGVEEVSCDQMCWVGAHSWPIRHRPQSSRRQIGNKRLEIWHRHACFLMLGG
jgi:hypothetical protein